jgi:hypothetical protein
MLTQPHSESRFHVEKERIDAVVTLANGDTTAGYFFVARASAHYDGSECVGELLNAEPGFFPFAVGSPGGMLTMMFNRRQVIMVALASDEARRDPGYDVATERFVSMLLSDGQRISGALRIHRPEGRNRLSDWARHADAFQYLEVGEMTVLVNISHVIEVHEVSRP